MTQSFLQPNLLDLFWLGCTAQDELLIKKNNYKSNMSLAVTYYHGVPTKQGCAEGKKTKKKHSLLRVAWMQRNQKDCEILSIHTNCELSI